MEYRGIKADCCWVGLEQMAVVDPSPTRTLFLTQIAHRKPTFLSEAVTRLTKELVEEAVTSGQWASARLLTCDDQPGKRH